MTPCDPHPVIWGRCPTCGTTIASTRQMPPGTCFSGGAAYAHHMPRNAYTGQPDEGGACMRCGEDVGGLEVAIDDEPTNPGAHWTEPLEERFAQMQQDMMRRYSKLTVEYPNSLTLEVGGETWVVKS